MGGGGFLSLIFCFIGIGFVVDYNLCIVNIGGWNLNWIMGFEIVLGVVLCVSWIIGVCLVVSLY